LNFDTSFTGEDRLRIRLQGRNEVDGNRVLSAGGGLANGGTGDFGISIDDFYYSFPVGSRLDLIIAANSIQTDDFVTSTIVPFDGPSVADAGGPVLYDTEVGGGGAFAGGFSLAITDNFVFDAGYSTSAGVGGGADPNTGGIFGAEGSDIIAQLSYLSDSVIDLGLVYIHGATPGQEIDTYGGLLSLDFGGFIIGGYYAQHDVSTTGANADDNTWQVGFAVPDLFIEGSQFGVYYANLFDTTAGQDPYMVEGYYAIPVNQFLTITPALIYGDLDVAGADSENFYGAIRATFSF
jgi:hypothetical protein